MIPRNLIALVFAPLALAAPVGAATVTLVSQQKITSSADTALVLNTGTYVSGANFGNANASTAINGVTFKATASGSWFEGPANTPGTFRYVSAKAQASGIYPSGGNQPYVSEFAALLDSLFYNSTGGLSLAVVGLDANTTYRLQLFAGDNRTASNNADQYVINSGVFTPNGGTGTFASNNDDLASFSFVGLGGNAAASASGYIETITFTGLTALEIHGVSGSPVFVSGMSLFTVPVPAPAALPAGAVLLGMVGLVRRRG